MRRKNAVDDREARQHGQSYFQRGDIELVGDGEHQRDEQHEAHLKEDRNADDERHDVHRPVHPRPAERRNQRARDLFGAARFLQQLAEHRAQAEHDADEPERGAEAGLDRVGDFRQRHPREQSDEKRHEDQGDERVDLQHRDQHEQDQN